VRGVHHITLRVHDLDRALAFYRDVVGLAVDQELPEKIRFQIPGTDTRLVLHLPLAGTPIGDKFDERRIGLDHLALRVDTHAELDALAQRLRAANVVYDLHEDPMGPALITFRDPDNVQWEFFGPTDEHPRVPQLR